MRKNFRVSRPRPNVFFSTQTETSGDGGTAVIGDTDIGLVMNHLNLAYQIEARLNEIRDKLQVNTTQMLVLALLWHPSWRAPRTAGPTELATQLQWSRETVSAQLRELAKVGLVEVVVSELDRRTKPYRLTQAGELKAKAARRLLAQLDAILQVFLKYGHDTSAHILAMRRLVNGLADLWPIENDRAAARLKNEIRLKRREESLGRNKAKGK